ncbi:hypothetical protein SBOR_6155 [Sclerotinia borealis F-4128]|uniref:N-acetyltransferase domain-containing protein n=1 Tax=Sclerotinia borealis (strain F-4128) TaxID=1432307 RepID=W9CCA7_SCLBF|nr:hypothetical protein SBOR_6155 [Sclerotinia borealis F-4128]
MASPPNSNDKKPHITTILATEAHQFEQAHEFLSNFYPTIILDLCFPPLGHTILAYATPSSSTTVPATESASGPQTQPLGTLVGCMSFGELADMPSRTPMCEIRYAFTISKHDYGIASHLVSCVIQTARDMAFDCVFVTTVASMRHSVKLYEELGFQIIEAYRDTTSEGKTFLKILL